VEVTERRLATAIEIACRAPDDHPFQVGVRALRSSLGMEGLTLALLHDSLEDGYLREDEYAVFPHWLRAALDAISHLEDDESYWDYIDRLSRGPIIAILVKLCDLKINLERSLVGESKNPTLAKRYARAIERLQQFPSRS
jgi:hypothetical protein